MFGTTCESSDNRNLMAHIFLAYYVANTAGTGDLRIMKHGRHNSFPSHLPFDERARTSQFTQFSKRTLDETYGLLNR